MCQGEVQIFNRYVFLYVLPYTNLCKQQGKTVDWDGKKNIFKDKEEVETFNRYLFCYMRP